MGKASKFKELRKRYLQSKDYEYTTIDTPKTIYIEDFNYENGIKAITVIKKTIINKTKRLYKEKKKELRG